jgi:hypothetical protein
MNFSIPSDVYSFGVFLVELVSGRSAAIDQSIIQWVNAHSVFFIFCDKYSPIYPLFIEALLLKLRPALFVRSILMCRYRTSRSQVMSLQSRIAE